MGGEGISTSEDAVSTSGEVQETTELGSGDTVAATESSTTTADGCGGVECSPEEECVDGQCIACTEPESCAACRADEVCQCPLRDPCCEVGMCIDSCDPLLQDCLMGEGCYPVDMSTWTCAPDQSGMMGAYGDPCDGSDECDPGLVCVNLRYVPDCVAGMMGCCSEVCDITDPAGNAQCSGAAGGQMCVQLYEPGTVPPGLENVGLCVLPP